ncbi:MULTISPECIES: DUF6980 family protein [Cytobacillus]|uniref:DUF6980 domain-containing protein n=1 Tax=Cytobacillus oceanisediminis TaxID=665099 RepID=A0ABX3CN03_9BACI|nr:hypothetical protein [Cytobacillus oceanisediminis]EFV75032.1 hypothetical protein HMPREF1013_04677 [Bacillus sp. 2_A_57_CT2]OHX44580.1 hypothetical protein BBV17_25485 [Cytobacillus oceanisediminis]
MPKHCCDMMSSQADFRCEIHSNIFECPDKLVDYDLKFDEYSLIIHDNGESMVEIYYCPWCGSKLPDSKRDLWFEKLESLGFEDPYEQEIPEEFQSDIWYKKKS